MKILLQNQHDGPLGGVETYFQSLIKALRERGIEVVVVYTQSGKKIFRNDKNYKAYYLPNLDLSEDEYYYGKRKQEIKNDLFSLRQIVLEEKPDIIHLNNTYYPGQFGFLKQYAPLIQTVHDFFNCCNILLKITREDICSFAHGVKCFENKCVSPFSIRELWRFKTKYQNRQATKSFDKLFVTSNYMKEVLILNGFMKSKIAVVPLFVNDWGKQQSIPQANKIIYVGRLAKEKGLSHFIKMLELISCDFKAFIIGDGPQKKECENLIKISGLEKKVELMGFLNRDELKEYFGQASVVVIPSLWPEPFCLVGLEAMASAKPIVAYNSGGIPDWLEDNHNGFLVKTGDLKSLAQRVELLLKDRNLSMELGENGRRLFEERFSEKVHYEKLISEYESLILSSKKNKKGSGITAEKKGAHYPVRLKGEALPEYNKRLIKFEVENNIVKVRSYPEEITVSTTTRCNMDPPCVICERNLREKTEEQDLEEEAFRKLKSIFKHADRIYLHCGGEPLMTQKSFDIIDSVYPPTKIIFNTNGALFNEKTIKYVVDRGTVDVISFSLDAATEKTYRRIRSADFGKVINNIKTLIAYRNERKIDRKLLRPLVLLNFCIFKQNVAEISDYILLASKLGADGVDFSHLNRGFSWRQDRGEYIFDYETEHIINAEDKNYHDRQILIAYQLGIKHEIPINFNGSPFLGALDSNKQKIKEKISEFVKYRTKCTAPWSRVVIEVNGQIRLCYFHHSYIDKNLGGLKNVTFEKIWNGLEAISIRKEFIDSGIAKRCITRNPCIYQNRI